MYKAAYKQAIALRKATKAPNTVIFRELSEAKEVREKWEELSGSGGTPKAVLGRAAGDKVYQAAQAELCSLKTICNSQWDALDLAGLVDKVFGLALDNSTPYRIRQLCEIERELELLGAQRLVDEIRSKHPPAEQWKALFQHVWIKSTLDSAAIYRSYRMRCEVMH